MSDQLEFPWDDKAQEPAAAAPKQARLPEPAPPSKADPFDDRIRAERLRAEVARRAGMQVQLRITDNASTMMSVRHVQGSSGARLSLHHMFLDAPPEIIGALAHWVRHPRGRKYSDLFGKFIRDNHGHIRAKTPRPATIETAGVFHDLRELFDEVNVECFGGGIACPITWGKEPPARRRRSIRLGSYSPAEDLIRIHPHLDADFVPRYFVRYIVFHEMLHAHLGIAELPSGRRAIHPPAFRRMEEAYPEYGRAIAWMDNPRNLGRLLRPPRGMFR